MATILQPQSSCPLSAPLVAISDVLTFAPSINWSPACLPVHILARNDSLISYFTDFMVDLRLCPLHRWWYQMVFSTAVLVKWSPIPGPSPQSLWQPVSPTHPYSSLCPSTRLTSPWRPSLLRYIAGFYVTRRNLDPGLLCTCRPSECPL